MDRLPTGFALGLCQQNKSIVKNALRNELNSVPYSHIQRRRYPMTDYSFDVPFSRDGTHAEKHERYRALKAIPMWVADTDFQSPGCVADALQARVKHGAFGYTHPYDSVNHATLAWLKTHYDWDVDASALVWLPGVVPAFNVASAAFTQPGNGIAVQTPNYPPLRSVAPRHGCEPRYIETVLESGRWTLDLVALEQHFQQDDCSLFILCNPMNPCGTRLTEAELRHISQLAQAHGVQICSDEIHCDLLLNDEVPHLPMGKLDPNAITLMAASKTFNIAGLSCSFAVIPNPDIRKRFVTASEGWMSQPNLLGLVATEAAFTDGQDWLDRQIAYLRSNLEYLQAFMPRLPGVTLQAPEATFLAWLDCTATGLQHPFQHFLDHGVALSDGTPFGERQFVRLNFGCSRAQLAEALLRMETALNAR